MAKFRVNQKVRIAGTLFCVTIKDVFDNGKDSKYFIEMENGDFREAPESELRLPIFEALSSFYNKNEHEVWVAFAFLLGFFLGITLR